MRRPLLCLPLALLFLVSAVPSNAQKGGGERTQTAVLGAPLAVECELRVEQRAEWRLEGRAPPPDMRASEAPRAGGGLTARLAAAAARPHHAGQYACSRAPDAPRVRVRLQPADDAEPVAAATAGSAAYEVSDSTILYYDLVRMNENAAFNISLDCSGITTDVSATIVWSKNGTEVEKLPELQGHYQLLPSKNISGALYTLTGRPREDDYGNYTCALKGQPDAKRAWQVRARTVAKLAANTNVVEGQKLKLQCKLVGRPYPPVKWMYSNISDKMENATDVKAVLGERVTVGAGGDPPVEGSELVVEPAARSDAGWYQCSVGPESHAAVTRLRVKDMYAALWPFLGICAEVLVLCAIILVYEKRRTKPELDDSDTDNHDQKKS